MLLAPALVFYGATLRLRRITFGRALAAALVMITVIFTTNQLRLGLIAWASQTWAWISVIRSPTDTLDLLLRSWVSAQALRCSSSSQRASTPPSTNSRPLMLSLFSSVSLVLTVSFLTYVAFILVPFVRQRPEVAGKSDRFEWHILVPCRDEVAVIATTIRRHVSDSRSAPLGR